MNAFEQGPARAAPDGPDAWPFRDHPTQAQIVRREARTPKPGTQKAKILDICRRIDDGSGLTSADLRAETGQPVRMASAQLAYLAREGLLVKGETQENTYDDDGYRRTYRLRVYYLTEADAKQAMEINP